MAEYQPVILDDPTLQKVASEKCEPEMVTQTIGDFDGYYTQADKGYITFLAGVSAFVTGFCGGFCVNAVAGQDMCDDAGCNPASAVWFPGIILMIVGGIIWGENDDATYEDETLILRHNRYFKIGMRPVLEVQEGNKVLGTPFKRCLTKKSGPSSGMENEIFVGGQTSHLAEVTGPGEMRYSYNVMEKKYACWAYRRRALDTGLINFAVEDSGPFLKARAQIKDQYPLDLLEYEVWPDLTSKKRCSEVTHFAIGVDVEPPEEDLDRDSRLRGNDRDEDYSTTVHLPNFGHHHIHMLSRESDGTIRRHVKSIVAQDLIPNATLIVEPTNPYFTYPLDILYSGNPIINYPGASTSKSEITFSGRTVEADASEDQRRQHYDSATLDDVIYRVVDSAGLERVDLRTLDIAKPVLFTLYDENLDNAEFTPTNWTVDFSDTFINHVGYGQNFTFTGSKDGIAEPAQEGGNPVYRRHITKPGNYSLHVGIISTDGEGYEDVSVFSHTILDGAPVADIDFDDDHNDCQDPVNMHFNGLASDPVGPSWNTIQTYRWYLDGDLMRESSSPRWDKFLDRGSETIRYTIGLEVEDSTGFWSPRHISHIDVPVAECG